MNARTTPMIQERPYAILQESPTLAVNHFERPSIHKPADVAALCWDMASLAQEQLRVLLLTTKNDVAAVHTVYVGTVNTSLVRPAEVFRMALIGNLPSIIVVHNHPSGDATPSAQDVQLTARLREVGELLSIELSDHVIIGYQQFVSLRERGWA